MPCCQQLQPRRKAAARTRFTLTAGRTDLLPPQRTSSASSANDARRALLQGGWLPVAAANARERIAVDLLVAFVAVAAEAKQGSGRDWSPRAEDHRPVRLATSSAGQRSACRSPPDVWLLALSKFMLAAARAQVRERVALALAVAVAGILAAGRARAGLLLPLLAERIGLGEVPHDLERARAASLPALPSHVNP
eukprot:tig00020753_g13685.t1